ncbi:hypothetical protein F4818DRAFT_106686 [Hypoxylon cercidicola]|nr:hypothetical protein F4818DRAFT_106686 [Hypoxylon cercidicola]
MQHMLAMFSRNPIPVPCMAIPLSPKSHSSPKKQRCSPAAPFETLHLYWVTGRLLGCPRTIFNPTLQKYYTIQFAGLWTTRPPEPQITYQSTELHCAEVRLRCLFSIAGLDTEIVIIVRFSRACRIIPYVLLFPQSGTPACGNTTPPASPTAHLIFDLSCQRAGSDASRWVLSPPRACNSHRLTALDFPKSGATLFRCEENGVT